MRFSPPEAPRDAAAERMVAELRGTNVDLTRFKWVGKIIVSSSKQPAQSFRAAMAGQLPDHSRIDLFSAFGGSAGTVSSDGKHLFLVMHPSREYYKRRFGGGSLQALLKIDITVADLLELLVGRIPMDAEFSARLTSDGREGQTQLVLIDGWDRTRQRITVDASMHPVASVWFDSRQNPIYTVTIAETQIIDGYVLPKRIDLSRPSGRGVALILDRYEANARFDEKIFSLVPPSS